MKEQFESAVYEYIKNNQGIDSVDIVSHFKSRSDITLKTVAQLEKDGKIQKKRFDYRYGYVALENQKEPWQMTKEEFQKTAVPLHERESFIRAWLRDNENIPNRVKHGINYIPQRDGALLVYGNERGQSVGILSFRKDTVDAIAISDRYKNMGIATKLIEESRKYGVRRIAGAISPEFAGIAHRFAVKQAFLEGKPIPQAVLREYPDLMTKAEKQRWRKA